MNACLSIIPDNGQYDAECEALYARNFGPGRRAKAAARLREGNTCRRDVSMLALAGDTLIGACRLWPVVCENGVAVLFLGPIAVDMSKRSAGLGQRLVAACLSQVDDVSPQYVVLVGDLGFFDRFGFEVVPARQVKMPGPVDTNRLLWRTSGQNQSAPAGKLRVSCVKSELNFLKKGV